VKKEQLMRRLLSTVLVSVVILRVPLVAEEKPTDAFQTAMKNNGDAMRIVRSAAKEIEDSGAGAQDYMPFEVATATMKTSFAAALEFWQAKKAADAVRLTQDAVKLVGELEAAAKDRDYRMVLDSIVALNQTCTTCHDARRAKLEDGSFGIK
jgi:cytochrome c556